MTSCLYLGLFKTPHTHTPSLDPRQPCPCSCSWERNWPRSTPGYFGKLLRTCVSCKHISMPSALLTQKRSFLGGSSWRDKAGGGGMGAEEP